MARNFQLDPRERGTISVLAAMSMMALMLVVALVVNIGIGYSEKAQLQNAADAAALAVAGECGKRAGTSDPCVVGVVDPTSKAIADNLANDNSNDGTSAVSLDIAADRVTAVASTVDSGKDAITMPISGVNVKVHATAAAQWGGIYSGVPMIPITFGACELDPANYPLNGEDRAILTHSKSKCSSSGQPHVLPGGFGWLDTDDCKELVAVDQWVDSDNGNSIKCESLFNSGLIGNTILVPIFDETRDKDKQFHISGWGVFHLKGYKLTGGSPVGEWSSGGPGGSDRGLYGHFITHISYSEGFTWGEPGIYGATQVKLIR